LDNIFSYIFRQPICFNNFFTDSFLWIILSSHQFSSQYCLLTMKFYAAIYWFLKSLLCFYWEIVLSPHISEILVGQRTYKGKLALTRHPGTGLPAVVWACGPPSSARWALFFYCCPQPESQEPGESSSGGVGWLAQSADGKTLSPNTHFILKTWISWFDLFLHWVIFGPPIF
jgi:hypothetical protein